MTLLPRPLPVLLAAAALLTVAGDRIAICYMGMLRTFKVIARLPHHAICAAEPHATHSFTLFTLHAQSNLHHATSHTSCTHNTRRNFISQPRMGMVIQHTAASHAAIYSGWEKRGHKLHYAISMSSAELHASLHSQAFNMLLETFPNASISINNFQRSANHFHHLRICGTLVDEYESMHGKEFDWVVMTRFDLLFYDTMPDITAFSRDRVSGRLRCGMCEDVRVCKLWFLNTHT